MDDEDAKLEEEIENLWDKIKESREASRRHNKHLNDHASQS